MTTHLFSRRWGCAAALLFLAALQASTAAACERRFPEANGDDRSRHVGLSARWPDAQILQNLRLRIDRAAFTRTESRDAVTSAYSYFERAVTISRSSSNAVEVTLSEAGRKPLVWKLGPC